MLVFPRQFLERSAEAIFLSILLWAFKDKIDPLDRAVMHLGSTDSWISADVMVFSLQVLLATNRIETLDPALLRPGRIDRKIEFTMPDFGTKRRIFQIHTSKMSLSDDVNLDEFVMTKDDLSGADIKAICTESGLLVSVPGAPSVLAML